MGLPLYLAMTAAEISRADALPEKIAYMACHFSPYSTGLSNPPDTLPEGSLLILNDRTPVQGHDPALIASQLAALTEEWKPEAILLDLQRPGSRETAAIAKAVVDALPCPVAVAGEYAQALACPVFLPPVPLHCPLAAYIAPWQGREVWLEAALEAERITVTKDGSQFTPLAFAGGEGEHHIDEKLHCRYQIRISEDRAEFSLLRTIEDLTALLREAQTLGITRAAGLYQEFGKISL